MDLSHKCGGLKNTQNASHVLAAVQAVLHTSSMVEFLIDDDVHRQTCKSLLQCMLCTLFKIYDTVTNNGVGDPTSLVRRWKANSASLTLDEQLDTQLVLEDFIDCIRMEHIGRNSNFTVEDFEFSPLARMWKSVFTCEVLCPSCGRYEGTKQECAVRLRAGEVDALIACITNEVLGSRKAICMQCDINQATINVTHVNKLADCLVVLVERSSSNFRPPLLICLWEEYFDLKSVIIHPSKDGPLVFLAMCPDGRCRRINDAQVLNVSLSNLLNSDTFAQRRLTLVFEKKERVIQVLKYHKEPTSIKPKKKDSESRITGLPKLSGPPPLQEIQETMETEIPHQALDQAAPMQKTVKHVINTGTQCAPGTVDAGTQCDLDQEFPIFHYEKCKQSDRFEFFTGLCVKDFEVLYDTIGGDETISQLKFKYSSTPKKPRRSKISSKDKLFMFLLRLRRGLPLEELSLIFRCSVSWAGEICYAMTRLIYLTFKEMEMEMFPTAAEQRKHKPQKMKPFKNLRVLIDGVSFFIQTPSNFEQQGNTFSSYKSHNVLVFSVGISCNGATIYCSEGMEGSMSDKEVILKSGLLDRLTAGDAIMTDRGYELTAELQAIGCELLKPPTLGGRANFTAEEEILTKGIAAARIYTEHAMADIKDNRLLQGVIPLTLLPVLSDLVYIAAYMRNFRTCRILNKEIVRRGQNADPSRAPDDDQGDPDDPTGVIVIN